ACCSKLRLRGRSGRRCRLGRHCGLTHGDRLGLDVGVTELRRFYADLGRCVRACNADLTAVGEPENACRVEVTLEEVAAADAVRDRGEADRLSDRACNEVNRR